MARELERAAHQSARGRRRRHIGGELVVIRLAMMPIEGRLRIEQVHLARAAVHEELDDRLGARLMMRAARAKVKTAARFIGAHGRRAEKFLAQQIRKRRSMKAGGDAVEETDRKST